MPPDAATAAVAPSSAPPLFGNKSSPGGPPAASPPKQPAAPAVQRAQQSPDARGESDRAAVDRQHDDAARRAGYGADGKPAQPQDPTADAATQNDRAARQWTDGTPAADAKMIKLTDDLTVSEDQYREVLARLGVEQQGIATRPTTPEGYELQLPAEYQIPAGADGKPIDFRFDPNSPMTADARAWAHKYGLSQAAFSEALQIVAADKINQHQQFQQAFNAEKQKLGVTGGQRVDALMTWFKGMLGDAGARSLGNVLWTADSVVQFEKLMQRFASQGAGGFSQHGREPGDNSSRLTEDQYNALPIGQRLEYARSANGGRR